MPFLRFNIEDKTPFTGEGESHKLTTRIGIVPCETIGQRFQRVMSDFLIYRNSGNLLESPSIGNPDTRDFILSSPEEIHYVIDYLNRVDRRKPFTLYTPLYVLERECRALWDVLEGLKSNGSSHIELVPENNRTDVIIRG